MQCDICGKEAVLHRTKIEGTIMNVCRECSSYGVELKEPQPVGRPTRAFSKPREEVVEQVMEGFASVIRNKREQLGLKQEDFAKRISEKESLVHKLETGHITSSIKLARKIEKFLGIRLVEQIKGQPDMESVKAAKPSTGFTLGDIIKVKKK